MPERVHVKKSMFGGHIIGYDCPQCFAKLKSPLDDAGKSDTCPQCGRQFIVPGADERESIRTEEAAAVQAKLNAKQNEQSLQEEKRRKQQEMRLAQPTAKATVDTPPPKLNLTACPDCKHRISRSAISCPNCGRPMSNL